MPSEESRRQFTNWFKKTYPQEHYLFNKIESNLDKLYSNDYLALNEGEFAEISLQIQKLRGDKYHLATNPYGAVFIGSLSKTIIQEFTSTVESIVSKRVKEEFETKLTIICLICKNMNLSGSAFCNICGTDLDLSKRNTKNENNI